MYVIFRSRTCRFSAGIVFFIDPVSHEMSSEGHKHGTHVTTKNLDTLHAINHHEQQNHFLKFQ
jgi:hypothetical protein